MLSYEKLSEQNDLLLEELTALRERVREMEEIRQGQRDIIDDYIGRMNAMQAVVDAAVKWDEASKWDGKESIEDAACNIGIAAHLLKDALAALEEKK